MELAIEPDHKGFTNSVNFVHIAPTHRTRNWALFEKTTG